MLKKKQKSDSQDQLLRQGVADGFAEIESGNCVDHDRAMEWLADLAAGKYRTPPQPE